MTHTQAKAQVITTLGPNHTDYDVDAITTEILTRYGSHPVIHDHDYWAIVERHYHYPHAHTYAPLFIA